MTVARPRQAGFTLLEVLLSLSVLSIVVLLLLSAFQGASSVRDSLSSRSREFRQVRLLLDRIGTDLSGAFASTAHGDSALTLREDRFSNQPAATLVFTAFQLPDTEEGRLPADIVKIKYFPRIGKDGATLEVHREQSDLPFLETRVAPRESVVAGGLRGFRVEVQDGDGWVKEWPPSGRPAAALPKKVSIALTNSRGETYRREIAIPLAGQEASISFSGRRRTAGQ